MAATLERPVGEVTPPADLCSELPLFIWQADPSGLMNYFNERIYKYSGATYQQLQGSGWLHLVHPEDLERVVHRWAYSLATLAPYEIEFRIRNCDRSYHWFLVRALASLSPDNVCLRWVGACTEVQRYAGSLPSADAEDCTFPRTLHESTSAPWLHQRELERVARRATAREASRAISHVLYQPLTAILSNSQALQEMLSTTAADPDELNQTVMDIIEEVRRAVQVLREWRVTLQGSSLRLESVHLNDIVCDAAALLFGDLVASQCQLQLQLAPCSPIVRVDAGQIQYALAMLIMNACEAMRDLPVEARRIHVRTLRVSTEHACIEVAARGPSVRDGVLRVFEPPKTTRLAGSGMGMAICKGIVEAHGGRLQFVTGPAPEGAVFQVELPAQAEQEPGLARTH